SENEAVEVAERNRYVHGFQRKGGVEVLAGSGLPEATGGQSERFHQNLDLFHEHIFTEGRDFFIKSELLAAIVLARGVGEYFHEHDGVGQGVRPALDEQGLPTDDAQIGVGEETSWRLYSK